MGRFCADTCTGKSLLAPLSGREEVAHPDKSVRRTSKINKPGGHSSMLLLRRFIQLERVFPLTQLGENTVFLCRNISAMFYERLDDGGVVPPHEGI
jgi:hypothetical protein